LEDNNQGRSKGGLNYFPRLFVATHPYLALLNDQARLAGAVTKWQRVFTCRGRYRLHASQPLRLKQHCAICKKYSFGAFVTFPEAEEM
jgi:hypothetical protein